MCGRTRCTVRVDDVGRACGFSAPLRTVDSDRFRPSYNISPGRYMPVVRHAPSQGGGVGGAGGGGDPSAAAEAKDNAAMEPVVHCMKWGLVPSFSKKNEKPDHFRMFNARSESVHIKSSFRRLLPKSRCVTTVEGFYEWKKDGAKKQPYYVHFNDGRHLVFACLYDAWKDEEGNDLHTFTILTTRSSKALDWLHDRMPVILPNEGAVNSWLNDDLSEESLHKITQPYEPSDLVWYPVTTAMGKPSFDNEECVQELQPQVASNSKIAHLFGKRQKEGSDQSQSQSQSKVHDGQTLEKESWTDQDKKSLEAGVETDHATTQSGVEDEEAEKEMPTVDTEGHVIDKGPKPKPALKTIEEGDMGSVENEDEEQKGIPTVDTEGRVLEKDSKLPPTKTVENDDMDSVEKVSQTVGKGDGQKGGDGQTIGLDFPASPSPRKPTAVGVGSPPAKRRQLSMSPKLASKGADINAGKADKQSSLLSFYGKQ